MTFDEWWASYIKPASIYTLKETTEDAWDAGVQEGLRRNREWVGLTKDEVADICESHYKYSKKVDLMVLNVFDHSRELEAKLKEKNT